MVTSPWPILPNGVVDGVMDGVTSSETNSGQWGYPDVSRRRGTPDNGYICTQRQVGRIRWRTNKKGELLGGSSVPPQEHNHNSSPSHVHLLPKLLTPYASTPCPFGPTRRAIQVVEGRTMHPRVHRYTMDMQIVQHIARLMHTWIHMPLQIVSKLALDSTHDEPCPLLG